MKKKVLYVMVGLITVLAILSCGGGGAGGGGGGSGGIQAKFRFTGGSAASRSITPSTQAARSSSQSVPGSEKLDELYAGKLGTFVASITPNKFELSVVELWLYAGNNGLKLLDLDDGRRSVNFAQPITITLREIPAGTYTSVIFNFWGSGLGTGEHTISFPWPGDIDWAQHYFSNMEGIYSNKSGNNLETSFNILTPGIITNWYDFFLGFSSKAFPGVQPDPFSPSHNIVMGGKSPYLFVWNDDFKSNSTYWRRIESDDEFFRDALWFVLHDIDHNLPPWSFGTHVTNVTTEIGDAPSVIIVPFNNGNGITVPAGASAVRFEITWDLNGLIERYSGATASPNDDIFILRNGYWNAFSIQAFIE